jgi:hypothetical protein
LRKVRSDQKKKKNNNLEIVFVCFQLFAECQKLERLLAKYLQHQNEE